MSVHLVPPQRERGVVLSGTGGVWRVGTQSADGVVVVREAALRGRLKQQGQEITLKLVAGDRVTLEEDTRGGTWTIAEIEPRTSQLARREPGGRRGERIVVANVDQVLVVFAAANPEPHRRMLDRFLIIAEGNHLQARIVINKIDLADPVVIRDRFADYVTAGYPLHLTSIRDNVGLLDLHDALVGRVSALSGPSGVGKSSLLNALYPGLNLRVGAISQSVNKGRHTTVGAVLHPLPDGASVADTPGLREVGLWGLPPAHLDQCFPEFQPYLGDCRFRNCVHQNEPSCAVRAAVDRGVVSAMRYDSYVKLLGELEATEQLRSIPSR